MVFAAPIWLLGLLPWAGVVVYLLPGRGKPAVVPFVALWRGTAAKSRWRARRWPVAAVLFALMALLLAILAAAGPGWISGGGGAGEVSIVLDRGATMALPSASRKPFRNVIARVPALGRDARVTLVPVPGQAMVSSRDAWAKAAAAMSPTAIVVQLDQVVANQLRLTRGPVFVLSDQKLTVDDPRIVRIEPEEAEGIVAITAIGARSFPKPQVLVRIKNLSDVSNAAVVVQSGDEVVRRAVALPAKGDSDDQFFDLPSLGATVEARIEPDGPNHPWSQAYLVRQSNGVHIAVAPAVDDSVRRVAEIYAKHRPALPNAPEVLISDSPLGTDQSGIWIAASSGAGTAGAAVVVPHAVTRNVNQWPATGAAGLPVGFAPVVSVGNAAVIAVHEDSARQVWVNADLRDWEKTPDFVVFFADVLDWIGGKDQSYAAVAPAILGEGYEVVKGGNGGAKPGEWPGIYRSDTGRQIAVNAGDVPRWAAVSPQVTTAGNPQILQQRTSMVGSVILGALACLLVSVCIISNSRKL